MMLEPTGILSGFQEVVARALWSPSFGSVSSDVRAALEALKVLERSDASVDDVRAALREFQRSTLKDTLPAVDPARALDSTLGRLVSLRAWTESTIAALTSDADPTSVTREWVATAEHAIAGYREDLQTASYFLRVVRRLAIVFLIVLACDSLILTASMPWPTQTLWAAAVAAVGFVWPSLKASTTTDRKTCRWVMAARVMLVTSLVVVVGAIPFAWVASHSWTDAEWPPETAARATNRSRILLTHKAPQAKKVTFSGLDANDPTLRIEIEYEPGSGLLARPIVGAVFEPAHIERLAAIRLRVLDDISTGSYLRSLGQSSVEDGVASPAFVNEWFEEDEENRVPAIGFIITNTTDEELSDVVIWPLARRTRALLGITAPSRVPIGRLAGGMSVFVALLIDPATRIEDIPASDNTAVATKDEILDLLHLSGGDLRALIQYSVEGTVVRHAQQMDEGLFARPRLWKALYSPSFSELLELAFRRGGKRGRTPVPGAALYGRALQWLRDGDPPEAGLADLGRTAHASPTPTIAFTSTTLMPLSVQMVEDGSLLGYAEPAADLLDAEQPREVRLPRRLTLAFASAFEAQVKGSLQLVDSDGNAVVTAEVDLSLR